MRSATNVTLALCASLNTALASASTKRQNDLCSTGSVRTAAANKCIDISDFHREISYDIAADIAQRSSQSICSATHGCTRGVHWQIPPWEGNCSNAASYNDVLRALDSQLYKVLGGKVCEAECVRIGKGGEWELHLTIGTNAAAVTNQVSGQYLVDIAGSC